MTSFQRWERPLHDWMLAQRQLQAKTGRILPQMNEEYGYEDHYPSWAPYKAPFASADADRRAAWEMSMAGCYQTTGETAKRGTGVAPDTGGGWVNGRGDETMIMLRGYAHMVHFFTGFEWWKAEPHDELVDNGAFCLAETGKLYVVYLPRGGNAIVKVQPGRYEVRWFNPRTGEFSKAGIAEGSTWTSPVAADSEDWVLLLVGTQSPVGVNS
jgi:Putative collagen-binding domain of a collagenase